MRTPLINLLLACDHTLSKTTVRLGGMHTLSPSQLPTLACPKRFHLEYRQRQPVLAPFATSFLGQYVHRAIQAKLESRPVAPLRLPARLILHEQPLDNLIARAEHALQEFETILPKLTGGLTEVFAEMPLENCRVRLRVDYLHHQGGQWHLRDWKTGGNGQPHLQVGTYLMWARHAFGTPRLRGHIHNLTTGQHLETPFQADLEQQVRDYYAWAADRLAQLDPSQARPGPHCRYCPYAWGCPVAAGVPYRLLDTVTGEWHESSATVGAA